MNYHQIRYTLEHRLLPKWYFKDKDKFILVMLENKDTILFNIMEEICKDENVPMQYSQEQYKIELYKLIDDINMLVLNMPLPESPLECYKIYLIFDMEFKNLSYFTLENSIDDKVFLCSWNEKGVHGNYGKSSIDDEKEIITKIFSIHMSKDKHN